MSLFTVIGISLRFENACKHGYIVVAVMGVPTYIYKSSFIFFKAEAGWFSQRCRKINHSKSPLSFLVPSLLQFTFSEDGK